MGYFYIAVFIMTNYELWQSTLGELELLISKANFTTWFKNTGIKSIENNTCTVIVPNAFTKAWLENKYHHHIIKSLQNTTGPDTIKTVVYKVEVLTNDKNSDVIKQTTQVNQEQSAQQVRTRTESSQFVNNSTLNPRYTFESFIVGKHNELARAAALAVADNPGVTYNPLFLYGGAGLGKTHLMQAVGHEILKHNPDKKVVYVPCEKFTNEFIQAIGSGKIERFKSTYRNVDLLMIDDIQFLAGKEGTQEEFFHTFNTLHQANKQIIISSDRPPKAIQTLENRLISRFEWGMIADIAAPDLETRTAILELKLKEKNYHLDKEIINFLATNIQNNVRELEGALNRIIAYHQLNNQPPSIENIKKMLDVLLLKNTNSSATPKKIIEIVSVYYGIQTSELIGASRKRELVNPRQIAMFLMREELNCSYPNIGQELGGRDHTTAMHACGRVQKLLISNEKTKNDVDNLRKKINQ